MEILLLRHGETEKNVKNVTHKHGEDTRLNEVGREQARRLAEVCRDHRVQKVYCSPETRAMETAGIIAEELDLDTTIVDGLTERHWGDWEGQAWSEIQSHLQKMSLDERRKFIPPNGESWEIMEQRLLDAVNEILGQGDVAAVVTHAGALRALMPPLKGDAIETSLGYEFDNASVTIFDQEADELIQTLENDTSHLRGNL